MKLPDLSRYAPPGLSLAPQKKLLLWGGAGALAIHLGFWVRFLDDRDDLYQIKNGRRVLLPGALMEEFPQVLGNALLGFFILALCMLAFALWYYGYHYQGSRSIYLMRRLPDRWELPRRCLTLPLAAAALCLLAALAVLLLDFGFYMLLTPRQCLPAGQWQKIWSVL